MIFSGGGIPSDNRHLLDHMIYANLFLAGQKGPGASVFQGRSARRPRMGGIQRMLNAKISHTNQERPASGAGSAAFAESLKAIRQAHELSQEDLARLRGASWATVSRGERRVSKPTPDAAARAMRLEKLSARIGQAIAPAEFVRFLSTPHPLLRGYQPIDLLHSAYSFEDLLAFIDSAKSGDAA